MHLSLLANPCDAHDWTLLSSMHSSIQASLNKLLLTLCRRLEQLSLRLEALYEKQKSARDEDEAEDLGHEVMEFERMLDGIGDSLGHLVKGNPDTFLQHSSSTLMPMLMKMLVSFNPLGSAALPSRALPSLCSSAARAPVSRLPEKAGRHRGSRSSELQSSSLTISWSIWGRSSSLPTKR